MDYGQLARRDPRPLLVQIIGVVTDQIGHLGVKNGALQPRAHGRARRSEPLVVDQRRLHSDPADQPDVHGSSPWCRGRARAWEGDCDAIFIRSLQSIHSVPAASDIAMRPPGGGWGAPASRAMPTNRCGLISGFHLETCLRQLQQRLVPPILRVDKPEDH